MLRGTVQPGGPPIEEVQSPSTRRGKPAWPRGGRKKRQNLRDRTGSPPPPFFGSRNLRGWPKCVRPPSPSAGGPSSVFCRDKKGPVFYRAILSPAQRIFELPPSPRSQPKKLPVIVPRWFLARPAASPGRRLSPLPPPRPIPKAARPPSAQSPSPPLYTAPASRFCLVGTGIRWIPPRAASSVGPPADRPPIETRSSRKIRRGCGAPRILGPPRKFAVLVREATGPFFSLFNTEAYTVKRIIG